MRCAAWYGVVLLAVGIGCGGDRVRTVDVSGAGDAVVALLLLDAAGAPISVSDTFGLRDGALDFGARPQVALRDGAGDAAWVRLPRAALEAAHPGLWDRRATIGLALEAPPSPPRVTASADGLEQTWTEPLPAGAEIVGADGELVRAALTLRFVLLAEPCRQPDRTPLRPYADRAAPLEGLGVTALHGLVLLDDRRAVVGGDGGVFVLERGQPFTDGPRLQAADVGADALAVTGLAVDPRTRGADTVRFVASVEVGDGSGGAAPDARVLQFALTPAGFTDVRTATAAALEIQALEVGAGGEVAATARGGRVLLSGPDGVGWRRHDVRLATLDGRTLALAFTGIEEEPLLVASVSRLHGLPADGGAWREYGLALFQGRVLVREIRVRDRVTWVAGSSNDLFRREGLSDLVGERVALPPRGAPCADAASTRPDRLTISRDIFTLAAEAQGPVLAYLRCGQLYRVRWSDRCVSVVPPGDGQATTEGSYTVVRARGDDIVAVDNRGRALISTRE